MMMESTGRFRMNDFINECDNLVLEVKGLLKQNTEWILRYREYAEKIISNIETIKSLKHGRFREWSPLYLYMNVTQAKSQMEFSLRYLGQEVARLNAVKDMITISTKNFVKNNERDFGCKIKLDDVEWKSKTASDFRRHFLNCTKRTDNSGKKNEEHRIESLILTEFSKNTGANKAFSYIQPVKIAGVARFQMPTPLYASDINNLKYCGFRGGGIDILARTGRGRTTKLCIMELKDENDKKEPPAKVIKQDLAYAVFIMELLRSESGQNWWKIFGFGGIVPKSIELYVVCVMPSSKNNNTSFADKIIYSGKDNFHFQYMYFQENNNEVVDVVTSLKKYVSK